MPPANGTRTATVLLLFLASGASGLVYEVVWSRTLQDVFGVSALAITTVVAAYMAGLALGSRWLGPVADRAGPRGCLCGYGIAEIAIGLFALASPVLVPGIRAAYETLGASPGATPWTRSVLTFVLSFTALLVPTTLMGGTLPLLARYLSESAGKASGGFGRAYATNTLGAVLGVLAATFVLLPALGARASLWAAGSVNLGIGACALLLGRGGLGALRAAFLRPRASVPDVPAAPGRARLLWIAGLGGATALGCEIVWVRGFAILMLSTTHVFALVLVVFLVGIALGSALGAVIRATPARLRALLAVLGVTTLTQIVFYTLWYERIVLTVHESTSYEKLLFTQAVMIATVVFPLTFCSGALLPVVVGLLSGGVERAGRDSAAAYVANTIGSVAGAVAAGFFVLPAFGWIRSSQVFALVAAAAVLVSGRGAAGPLSAALLAAVAVVAPPALGPADLQLAVSPTHLGVQARKLADPSPEDLRGLARFEGTSWGVLERRHGLSADAAVTIDLDRDVLSLWINGVPNASTGDDQPTQLLMAVLPYVYGPRVARCLHVGLGSGITAGAWAALPGTDRVDVVELEGQLFELSRLFDPWNFGLHRRAGVRRITYDARPWLALQPRRSLDIVCSQPSQLWAKGVASLFTTEFFATVRDRLAEDGVFVTWIMGYSVPAEVFAIAVATLLDAFPHVHAFSAIEGDVVFVCSNRPLAAAAERLRSSGALSAPQRTILRALEIEEPGDLVRYSLADDATLRRLTRGVLSRAGRQGVRNTADHPVLEHLYPRYFTDPRPNRLLAELRAEQARRARQGRAASLMPPGLADLRPRPASLLELAARGGFDPLPLLAGTTTAAALARDPAALRPNTRKWLFVSAVRASRHEAAARLWPLLEKTPLTPPVFAKAAIEHAHASGAHEREDDLLRRAARAYEGNTPWLQRLHLRRLFERDAIRRDAAAAAAITRGMLDAFEVSDLLVQHVPVEWYRRLAEAAWTAGLTEPVLAWLEKAQRFFHGRSVAVALALFTLRVRRGEHELAAEVIAPYRNFPAVRLLLEVLDD